MKFPPSFLPDWRHLAAYLALAAIAGVLWLVAVDAYRQGEIAQHRRELAAITEVKLQRIQALLAERRNDAAVLGGLTFAREALAAAANSPQQADPLRQLELIRAAYRYQAVLLFDAKARLRLAAGAADSDEIAAVLDDNDGFASGDGIRIASLRLRAANGGARLLLQIVAPVRGNGARAGTLVLLADSLAVTDPIAAVNRGRIASREVGILERRGAELRVLNTPLFARPAELSVDANNPLRPAAMAAQGKTGAIEGEDYRGVPVIAHVGRIPDSDWLIVTKEDRADALASTNAVALWSGALTVLLLLAAGIALAGRRRLRQNELALARSDAAQQALRSSEARFRKLNEHATDISLLFDRAMVVRYATPSAAGFIGRAAEGEPMASGTARVHPDDVARVEAARRAALDRPGVAQSVRHRLLHGSDGWRVMEATFTSLFDDPEVDGLSYQAHDVTARVAAEQALRDSEERYRFLFENSPLPMWIYDLESLAFLEANRAAVVQYGYSRQEFLAMTLRDIRPPEDVPAMIAAARATTRQQGSVWTHRRRDGSLIKVAIWSQPAQFSGRPARMILAENVTARVEAELALAESEARLRAVIEHAPVGIAIADAEGRYSMVNPAQCRMLGYDERELLGMRFAEVTHHEDVQANLDLTALVLNGDSEVVSLEKRYVRKDGSLVWVLLTVARIHDAGGAALGTVGIAQDITERREAEAQRLAHTRRQRDALVREVHHRIKNHLQGLAGLMRQQLSGQLSPGGALEEVIGQVNAISIVHGLLGRTEQGQVTLRGLATEIAAFLGGITGVPLRLAEHAGQCFLAEACPHSGECRWSVVEEESVPLALVLNELLTNAVRHRAGKAPPELDLSCDGQGGRLVIRNPGRLPEGLDVARGKGLGTGLGLVRSLLPGAGATLTLAATVDGQVETTLVLAPPVVVRTDAAATQLASRR